MGAWVGFSEAGGDGPCPRVGSFRHADCGGLGSMEVPATGCFNSHHASPQHPSMAVIPRINMKRINMVLLQLGELDSRGAEQLDAVRTTGSDLDLTNVRPLRVLGCPNVDGVRARWQLGRYRKV